MGIAYLGSPNITINEALDLAVSQYWGNRNQIVATYYTDRMDHNDPESFIRGTTGTYPAG